MELRIKVKQTQQKVTLCYGPHTHSYNIRFKPVLGLAAQWTNLPNSLPPSTLFNQNRIVVRRRAMATTSVVPANRRRAVNAADDMDFETTEGVKAIASFEEMGIKDDLLRGIYQYGFEKPSAIQQRAVTPIIQGRDVIAQAQSGTGKTSMIALTVCQVVDTSVRE